MVYCECRGYEGKLTPMREPDNAVPLLEIKNAGIWRGSTRVFENLSLEIPRQQSIAIIGPNGSGKTTLAKVLSREIYPVLRSDSYVKLLGKSRFSIWDYRRTVGVIAEDAFRLLAPTTTARDAVLSAFSQTAGLRGIERQFSDEQLARTAQILKQFALDDMANRAISTLSTGQIRRTMICRALVHRPQLVLLDEPTTGLDLASAFEHLHTVRQLIRAGVSVVQISHHINEIVPEVDRVIALKNGSIAHDGNKRSIFTSACLSELYATAIRVIEVDGLYAALPA